MQFDVNKWSRRLVIAVHQTTRQPGERSAHLSPIDSLHRARIGTSRKITPLCKFGSVGLVPETVFSGSEFASVEAKIPAAFLKLRKSLEGEQWISLC